jgi:DNA-directed RNA polymerase subunit alpha
MEIWTDGGVTPEKAVSLAAAILIEHMNLFLLEDEDLEEEGISAEQPDYSDAATEDPIFNANLLKSVDELELSVRSYNCLKNANIKTIADLVQKTEQEMLRTKNFGRKSLNEIKEILHGMGLRLGMRVDLDALNREVVLHGGGVDKDATQS